MSAAELVARDAAGNSANNGRGNTVSAGPFNGLSATTAVELQQLARAALSGAQPAAPLFTTNDALAAAVGSNNQQMLPSDPLAAVSAALAGFAGQPHVVSAQPTSLTEGALNALLLSGINLGNFGTAGFASYLGADLAGVQLAAGLQPAGLAGGSARDMDDDDGMGKGGQGNKQLSSRFRQVLHATPPSRLPVLRLINSIQSHRKNKRWQAAINSGGKYIYLGSFTSEEDAARQFDRAAIKIRGKKAKLNYLYADYVDADGNLLEDLVLPTGPAGGSSGGGRKGKGGAAAGSEGGFMLGPGNEAIGAAGLLGSDMLNQAALTLLQQGQWAGAVLGGRTGDGDTLHSSKGRAQSSLLNMSDLKAILPKGCSLDYMLPGMDADMFGLVYKSDSTGQRGCGVWTGYRLHLFGMYADEQDAKQSIEKSMQMLHEDRQLRAGGGGGGSSTAGFAGTAGQADVGSAAGSAAEDPLIAALGLGGLRAGRLGAAVGVPAAAAPSTAGARGGLGLLFETARAAEGVTGLANYDIAKAARLAQEAAAQQGVSMQMGYAPLTGGAAASGSGASGLGQAVDLQQRLNQIAQLSEAPTAHDQVQQSTDGGMLSRLGGAGGPGTNWSDMSSPASGINTVATAAAEPAADGGASSAGGPAADGPIAKRQRLSEAAQGVANEDVVSGAVAGAGAGSGGGGGEGTAVSAATHGSGGPDPVTWGQGQSLMKVNLQDALKTICAIAQQQ
eukprot:gene6507-6734_t